MKKIKAAKIEKKPGTLTRALYDLGFGVWFGGSVFGILAMNPAVEVLDDPEERGKMVDEGWARFQEPRMVTKASFWYSLGNC